MEKVFECKNCYNNFNGNFCSSCGQASSTKRIDFHYIIHDIPHSILHIDKGLPYTFFQLIKNPGKALLEYLEGKRVKFFKPFAYVIILSTLSSLFIKFTSKHETRENNESVISFFSHYPSILIFGLIPIVSIVSWLIFKKKNFNYWEHFLVHTYLAAQINIMLVIMNLISLTGVVENTGLAIKLTLFNTMYMTYHGFTFSSLITHNYQDKFKPIQIVQIGFCCFFLGSIYAYALAYTGIARIWF